MPAYDFTIEGPGLGQQFLSGFGQGQQLMAQHKAQQRQAQMQEDLAAFAQNQNKTIADYEAMMQKYPEIEKQMQSSLDRFTAQQKENKVDQLMSFYVPLKSGNVDAAKARLDELISAYENSGNEIEAQNMRTLRDNIDIDPKGAITSSELFLFKSMDPERFKKFAESQGVLGEEKRSAELQPEQIKLKKAEVIKAGLDAGLTEQEAMKMQAQTKKLDAETQKLIMEMEAMKKQGPIPDEKKFDQERKLAKEYQANTKNFTDVQEAYRRIQATEDNAAGDLSMIFSYMKMLDPGSVVREGEFATAQNAAGVPQRVMNIYNRILEGERLGDKQRKQFRSQAEGLFKAASKREKEVRSGLEKVISNYGLNAENIFVPREAEAEEKQPAETKKSTNRVPIKTGTYQGRKVNMYADGSIEYAD